jgi:putative alpha-1,2-mannosidase
VDHNFLAITLSADTTLRFDSMTINLDDTLPSTSTTTVTDAKNMARTLKITATGLPADVKQIVYVQSLKVNGIAWDKAWLSWSDIFENGGTMEFVMGPNVVDWATGDLPPSPAS